MAFAHRKISSKKLAADAKQNFQSGQNIYQQFPTRECSLYFTKINVINVNRYNTGQSLIEHPAQQHSVKTEIRFCADTQRPLRKNEYCSHENV